MRGQAYIKFISSKFISVHTHSLLISNDVSSHLSHFHELLLIPEGQLVHLPYLLILLKTTCVITYTNSRHRSFYIRLAPYIVGFGRTFLHFDDEFSVQCSNAFQDNASLCELYVSSISFSLIDCLNKCMKNVP